MLAVVSLIHLCASTFREKVPIFLSATGHRPVAGEPRAVVALAPAFAKPLWHNAIRRLAPATFRCRSTFRTTLAWMTAVEYQWHRALTCTDTRSDHWVAASVCGCAEYILSTSPQGPEGITPRSGRALRGRARLPPITPGEQTCQPTRRRPRLGCGEQLCELWPM